MEGRPDARWRARTQSQETRIFRDVQANRTEYVITYHGQPVAVLLPIDEQWLAEEPRRAAEATAPGEDVWAELKTIRKEIGENWQAGKTAVELVSEQRR
jgi:antitoxin (DNA-binding transcriptional repressor) of toxin-antitoxin stability system